jgi:flagellar hook-length control protein FliK
MQAVQSGPTPVATSTNGEQTQDTAPTVTAAATPVAEVASGEEAPTAQVVGAVVEADDAEQAPEAENHGQLVAKVAHETKSDRTQVVTPVVADEAAADEAATDPATRPVAASTPAAVAQQNVAAQARSQRDAAASEAESGSAPARVESTSSSSTNAQPLTAGRSDQIAPGLRIREAAHAQQLQARIDHIAEQLATRLRLSQAAGGSQVQLSLRPRELGDVTVQMNVREGVVAATVLVDRQDTLRTLQTNIEDLKRSLEQQGLSIQEFSVDVRGDASAGGANAREAARSRSHTTGSSRVGSIDDATLVTPGLTGSREVDPDDLHDGNVSVLA